MSKQNALLDYERFSDEEAVTVVRAERPTPHFPVPRALLDFGAGQSGEMRVAPPALPEAHSGEMRIAPLGPDEPHWGEMSLAPSSAVPPFTPELTDEQVEHEEDFWASSPRYSSTTVRPSAPLSLAPAPAAGRRRTASKVLFAALFSGVVTLLAYEALVLSGFRW